MIRALIGYQGKQINLQFPKPQAELNSMLQSIGITQQPEDIFPKSPDKNDCQIWLFAEDIVEHSLIELIREKESLAMLNHVIQMFEGKEYPTMYDIVTSRCARSLRQIVGQLQPESSQMQKLQLSSVMNNHTKSIISRQCIVEKTIPLSAEEFAQLLKKPENFKNMFRQYDDLMYWDVFDVFHCILPYDAENGNGLLIDTEGHDQLEFYQFVPNAKLLIEHHEAELNQTADFSEEESQEIGGISM